MPEEVWTRGDDEDAFAFDNHEQNISLSSRKYWPRTSAFITTCLSRPLVRVQIVSSRYELCPFPPASGQEQQSGNVNPAIADLLADGLHGSPDRGVVYHDQGNGPQQAILKRKVLRQTRTESADTDRQCCLELSRT
jgi:hypothetical protein